MRQSAFAILILAVLTGAVLFWPAHDSISGRTTVNLTVWGMPFEDRLFRDRYAREWEAQNPGLRVNYQRFGDDLLMKYNAWHTRGRGSEVMRLRITDYHGMVERGMLEPLDGFLNSTAPGAERSPLDVIPRHLTEALKIDGRLYAIPEDNAQFGMFINLDLVDAHNRAHPGERIDVPRRRDDGTWEVWTWEDLRRAARLLTERDSGGGVVRAGFDFTVWSWPFMTFHAQAGGKLWSDDGLTCTMDGPAGIQALEFFRALQREDRSFVPNLSGFQSGTGPDVLFAAGKTAIFLDGSWRVPNIEQVAPQLNFCVVPLPRGRVPAVVSGCVCWGISSDALRKDEGWRMIRYLTDEPQALAYWDMLRVAPPANLAALASPEFRSPRGTRRDDGTVEVPPMPADRFDCRGAWLLYANTPDTTGRTPGFVPTGPYQTELEEEIQRMLNRYLNPDNREAAQGVLTEAVRNVHAVIDRDRAARGLPPVQRPQSPGP